MGPRVLIAGIGNIFCGDDGFGPEVVRHLASAGQPALPAGVTLVDYGIRGLHLAYDVLDGYDALVLVDALPGEGRPGELKVLEVGADDVPRPAPGAELDAHSMSPVAVLSSVSTLGGQLPPTYVVGALPADLSEGIGLSEPMTAAVPRAADTVRALLQERLDLDLGADDAHEMTPRRSE
ncbi:MAG: Hydrogenase maturation protease [uncultured Nocardioidaceae bacterium]|uniref:Hydrogenase maturation protease n=1 Tax=uncultured Nocardioidaceae bacterium TaxID=253824 RepID=A0A6J4N8S9_9ACTN|nr:MAG: Hydrogenase maturation protease [uncultured Nocardioidaceae bacterium]